MLKDEKDVTLTLSEAKGREPETQGLTTVGVLAPSVAALRQGDKPGIFHI
jgi:hypothetical protein